MNPAVSLRSFLSKLNFLLGRKPKVLAYSEESLNKFIPSPYRAVLIISCDFELAWAWRFAKQLNCDLEKAKEIARQERRNIPIILDLCERFNIPITWAILGHLFLENCSRKENKAHTSLVQPNYFENKYWKFDSGEWFGHDPCCLWKEAPEWYAPDLIEKITKSQTKHEIGCHTFSHISCQQEVCSRELLRKEIKECKALASKYKINLNSFIFPGNFIGNLAVLKEEGFTSYRIEKDVLGLPVKDEYGLWQFPTTAEICLFSYGWNLGDYLYRYTTIIERAIKYRRLCNFWFHPSFNLIMLEKILPEIFKFIDDNRNKIWVITQRDYVEWLENNV
jgi:peptidoglycan/xylan/chitin deacetylase (PgdA/CDA1 family)